MARKSPKTPHPPHLDGALDIQRVIERRSELAAASSPAQDAFILDLSAVTHCDTAGLQLLCSTRRSVTLNGREWRPQNASAAVLRACSEVGIQPEDLGL